MLQTNKINVQPNKTQIKKQAKRKEKSQAIWKKGTPNKAFKLNFSKKR